MGIGVFVVGAPRSGTTWLQAMLGAHPKVVSPQETCLVPQFLAPWTDTFERQVSRAMDVAGTDRVLGLPVVLTRERFVALQRTVLDEVADAALAMKPGATIVVEKTPDNALHVPLIMAIDPDARFVHLVRDGRDVVASLLAASASWGDAWAPNDLRRAAEVWRDHVLGARKGAAAGSRYAEVRYEDLLAEPAGELARLLHHCGVDVELEEAGSIAARFAFENMAGSSSSTFQSVIVGGEAALVTDGEAREPDGFFRVGRPGSWEDWSDVERWTFDDVAGELLVELGYEPDRSWAAPGGPRDRAQRVVARTVDGARRASKRIVRQAVRRVASTSS